VNVWLIDTEAAAAAASKAYRVEWRGG